MNTNARIQRLTGLRGGDKAPISPSLNDIWQVRSQIAQERLERSYQVSTTAALYRTTADRVTELTQLRSLKNV
jgi:hypothetical protein